MKILHSDFLSVQYDHTAYSNYWDWDAPPLVCFVFFHLILFVFNLESWNDDSNGEVHANKHLCPVLKTLKMSLKQPCECWDTLTLFDNMKSTDECVCLINGFFWPPGENNDKSINNCHKNEEPLIELQPQRLKMSKNIYDLNWFSCEMTLRSVTKQRKTSETVDPSRFSCFLQCDPRFLNRRRFETNEWKSVCDIYLFAALQRFNFFFFQKKEELLCFDTV